MNTVKVENCKTLFIGRRGENEVTEVVFDFTEWQEQFGTGVIDLYVKRSVDLDAYPVVLSIDGTVATWLVTAADTDVVGSGKIEFVYTVDQKVAKSAIFPFYVGEDIGQASSEPPDPYESWIETLTELGTETQENAQAAAQSASDAADSAASASESAGQAEDSAEDAEAWAVGERNGEPVSEDDPTYNNNAKYWAENARANAPVQSVNGEDGDVVLTLDDIQNGETFARATPEQLAQIGKNADDIADIDAMIPSITSESNHLVNVSFLTNRLTSYRTSAAQDTIDSGKQAKITATGILKGDGAGGVSSSAAGTDYATPQQVSEKYTKPADGIPSTDMTAAVQASLSKAESALQAVPDTYRTAADQDTIDSEQDERIDGLEQTTTATAIGPVALATFEASAADMPLKGLTVNIEPVQSGSGDPSPDNVRPITGWTGCNVARTGKNLLKYPYYSTSRTVSGITFTVNDDGSVTVNGTSTANADFYFFLSAASLPLPNGSYIFSSSYTGQLPEMGFYIHAKANQTDTSFLNISIGNEGTYTVTNGVFYTASIRVLNGNTVNNVTVYPMIRLASETDNAFEPYKGNTYNITFPTEAGTVYGGTLDVVNRKLNSYPYYSSYNGETIIGPWISSMDVYTPGATPTLGAQVVDMGGAATSYDLSDVPEITTFLGENNIWANRGDVTVTYGAYLETVKAYADKSVSQSAAQISQNASDISDLKSALKSGDEEDAIYHLGFYLDENGDLCQVEEETNNG